MIYQFLRYSKKALLKGLETSGVKPQHSRNINIFHIHIMLSNLSFANTSNTVQHSRIFGEYGIQSLDDVLASYEELIFPEWQSEINLIICWVRQ